MLRASDEVLNLEAGRLEGEEVRLLLSRMTYSSPLFGPTRSGTY